MRLRNFGETSLILFLPAELGSDSSIVAAGLGCVETDSSEAAVVDNRRRPPMFSRRIVQQPAKVVLGDALSRF
jgi:hypothetical protein